MARTEKQLQAAFNKGKISLSEFHEALLTSAINSLQYEAKVWYN